MASEAVGEGEEAGGKATRRRAVRSDAQRSIEALLRAAKEVFASSGIDAPVREIAEKAGVGIGTLYRNFPQRSDLVAAVFRHEVDACADAAPILAAEYTPGEALERWIQRFVAFLGTKRGFAPALHSGNPVFAPLPAYFLGRLQPAFQTLLEAAAAAGHVRPGLDAGALLLAIASLSSSGYQSGPETAESMVGILVDGLRFVAGGKPPERIDRAGRTSSV